MKFLLYVLPVALLAIARPETTRTVVYSYPAPEKKFFRFGDQLLTLEKYDQSSAGEYVLVSLHGNEAAAVDVSRRFAQYRGLKFMVLKGRDEQKMIRADLHDRRVVLDPEKIFTNWGRRVLLKKQNNLNKRTIGCVEQLAKFVTKQLDEEQVVVSVHNAEGVDGMKVFMKGGDREKEVEAIYVADAAAVTNYVLTTDVRVYEAVKAAGMNVVWQKRGKVEDDGSLNVYCSKSNREYVRIEAAIGDEAEMARMLTVVDRVLGK